MYLGSGKETLDPRELAKLQHRQLSELTVDLGVCVIEKISLVVSVQQIGIYCTIY